MLTSGGPVIPRNEQPLGLLERLTVVIEVLATYCRVRWTFSRRGLADAVRILRSEPIDSPPRRPDDEDAFVPVERLAYIVQSVLRLLPTDSRCLMRSLVLTRVLARRGLSSSLHIGVATDPQFAAHAWVEYGGRPVLPNYAGAFSRLHEL